MKTSYIFLADGFEEVEALTVVDLLRRAGISVQTVSITADPVVRGAHGIPVVADISFGSADPAEFAGAGWLITPGGIPGSPNLAACAPLQELLRSHAAAGGRIAAICAAPAMVLAPLGILDGRTATGYPGTTAPVGGVTWTDSRVVVSGNVVTANGPSSAMPFALAIIAETLGKEASAKVAAGLLCDCD